MRKKFDEPMPIAFVAASYLISVVPQSLHAYAITGDAGTVFLYFFSLLGRGACYNVHFSLHTYILTLQYTMYGVRQVLRERRCEHVQSVCHCQQRDRQTRTRLERPESLCDTSLRLNGTYPPGRSVSSCERALYFYCQCMEFKHIFGPWRQRMRMRAGGAI